MPSERRPRTTARTTSRSAAPPPEIPELPGGPDDGTTGRLIVLLAEGADQVRLLVATRAAGVRVASSADLGVGAPAEPEPGGALHLDTIGVVVIEPERDQLAAVAAASSAADGVVAVEPERIVYAIDGPSNDYVQGFRDGVDDLADRVLAQGGRRRRA